MNKILTNKVVLIIGAKDVGAATAVKFAQGGAKIVIDDIDHSAAQQVATEIGERAIAIQCDVSQQTNVIETFQTVKSTCGRLDALINLAGPYRPQDPLEQWEFMITSNLLGTLYTCRSAIELMKSTGGTIVNIASYSGLGFGPEQQPAYGAAKAGVMRFTAAMNFLDEKYGIRINCLVPDWIGTKAVMGWINSLTHEQKIANQVPDHMTTVEEFADAIVDLSNRTDYAGRVALFWSGKPLEVIEYGDQGYAKVIPY